MTPTVLPAPATELPPIELDGLLARWRRRGLVAVGLWLLGFIAWSQWAPISGAVVGSGLVKVEANRQTVSHRDGGIVARMPVREGQIVAQGETLLVLEDARIDSTVELLRAQLVAEGLRRSRLEAEAALAPQWVPVPAAVGASGAAGAARTRDAIARERSAFEARRRSLRGQLDAAAAQIRDTTAEIQAYQRNNVASAEALKLLRDEIAANEALLQENFVNRTRVLGLKRGLSDYESRIETSEAELSKARQHKAELEGRLASLRLAYVEAATEDLRESTARIVDLEERLRAAGDTAGRQAVLAPVAGRLVGLRFNTIGSAIGPREAIVDIVPSDVPLVVETRVAAEAVSEVQVGQLAEVRLLGYRQRSTGLLAGQVVGVSADALVEERSGAPYFAVQVEVKPEAVAQAGLTALMPGMATEVYIKTSARTPLEFLLEPLTAGVRRSFREH